MRKYLLIFIALLSVMTTVSAQTGKGLWRVVIVAASSEPSIREGAEAFLSYTSQQVAQMSQTLGLNLDLHIIKDKDLNPKKLNELLSTLQNTPEASGKNMLTWISFSHGFNTANAQSKLPYLIAHPTKTVLSPQEMRYAFSLEDIYNDLLKSEVYEHVHVWAELCNHICLGCQQMPTEGLVGLGGGNPSALEQLLYSVKGEVMVSSSYGQASCSSVVGGPFSRGLFEALSMVEMGDSQAPTSFEGEQGFFRLVQALSLSYAKQLPQGACQEQIPVGYVSE